MQKDSEITIADVARAAGVSVSTVSRILNNKPDVAAKTRQRVLKVIDELGYTPHVQAQRLAGGKSRTIALHYPLDYLTFSQQEMGFINGVGKALDEADFFFNLITTPITPDNLLRLFSRGQVDGAILMEIELDDWRVKSLLEAQAPFVMIGRREDNTGLNFVDKTPAQDINAIFRYLVEELGHQEIGFFNFPESLLKRDYGTAVRTKLAYEQMLEKYHLERICTYAQLDSKFLYEATKDFLTQHPHLTAAVTVEGSTAVGVIQAVQESGLRIPDDFSLITITPRQTAEFIRPNLTHIDFPSFEIGYQTARMLISILNKEPLEVSQILFPPELIIRESTAPTHRP
jgi:DNA-binding LacI/PurR family transcriptional regulator